MKQALTMLEVAKATSKNISDELERNNSEFILVHRQCAEVAVDFVNKLIEYLNVEDVGPDVDGSNKTDLL